MRELRCAEVQEMLPAYADEPGSDLSVRRHLATCEACKLEVDRYEAMRRGLQNLTGVAADPPYDLLPALLEIPDADNAMASVKTHVLRNRRAYASGAAVLLAGAAGAAIWRSRRRLVPA